MKKSSAKENVIKPAITGVLVIILGVGLLVYYACFAKNPTAASYVLPSLAIAAGVFITVSAILRIFKVKSDEKVLRLGTPATATFVSYNSDRTSGKVAVYYVEYAYEIDGKRYVCKSPSEYNWYEVLTLKVVGQFPIKTYNGKSVLDCNLMQMHLDNREAVAELNSKYEKALEELVQK